MLAETLAALQLTVTLAGTAHEIRLRPGDLVRFETHFGRSLVTGEGQSVAFGVTELMFLGWCGCKRDGLTSADFDGFLDEVDDVDVATADVPKVTPPGKGLSPA